jgi:hypothetical protein
LPAKLSLNFFTFSIGYWMFHVSWLQTHTYSPTFPAFSFLADPLPALMEANFERGFLHKASCGLSRIKKKKIYIYIYIHIVVAVWLCWWCESTGW